MKKKTYFAFKIDTNILDFWKYVLKFVTNWEMASESQKNDVSLLGLFDLP